VFFIFFLFLFSFSLLFFSLSLSLFLSYFSLLSSFLSYFSLLLRSAPEVLRREKQTCAADIWSFGVLVWEVFAIASVGGIVIPYTDNSTQEVIKNICSHNEKFLLSPSERIFTHPCAEIYQFVISPCLQFSASERISLPELQTHITNCYKAQVEYEKTLLSSPPTPPAVAKQSPVVSHPTYENTVNSPLDLLNLVRAKTDLFDLYALQIKVAESPFYTDIVKRALEFKLAELESRQRASPSPLPAVSVGSAAAAPNQQQQQQQSSPPPSLLHVELAAPVPEIHYVSNSN